MGAPDAAAAMFFHADGGTNGWSANPITANSLPLAAAARRPAWMGVACPSAHLSLETTSGVGAPRRESSRSTAPVTTTTWSKPAAITLSSDRRTIAIPSTAASNLCVDRLKRLPPPAANSTAVVVIEPAYGSHILVDSRNFCHPFPLSDLGRCVVWVTGRLRTA